MQQYIDSVINRGGAAVSGASVLVKDYATGDTSTIYSDDGVTAASNPLTTDANGGFSFYAADGRYTLVISKTGVISQRTISDILLQDPDDGTAEQSSADVAFLQSGSGASATTLQSRGRLVVYLDDFGCSGDGSTDDLTKINACLLAHAGKIIVGTPGKNYAVSGPIVIYSNTTLEMWGCDVTLLASSNSHIIENYAVSNTNRSVSDAAITSSDQTLTSATANFTSADVGRTVVITGAGISSSFPLCTTIASFTSSTSVELTVAAGTTVSGAACSIYERDTNISVLGGTWNRGSNGGSVTAADSLFFRRVDGLTINIEGGTSSAGKYMVTPGDVTNFDITARGLNTSSDGVHVRGPASNGVIRHVEGITGDDFCILGAADNTRTECAGDITDVYVGELFSSSNGTGCALKIYGESGTNCKRIHAHSIRGTSVVGGVQIGASGFTGGNFDEIQIDNIDTDYVYPVQLYAGGGRIRIGKISSSDSVGTDVMYGVDVKAGITWGLIAIGGMELPNAASCASGTCAVNVAGTVTDLFIEKVKFPSPSSGATLQLAFGTSAATVTRAWISDVSQSNGGAIVKSANSSHTLGTVWLSDIFVTAPSFFIDLATTTVVHVSNVQCDSPTSGSMNLRATAVVSILGAGASKWSGSASTTAGYALRVNCPDLSIDPAKITTATTGDRCRSTGTTPGTGNAVWDGSRWNFADYSPTVAPTYSTSITPVASQGRWQTITVTDNVAFTIQAPTSAPQASRTDDLAIEIYNNSGGVMGAITWNSAFVLQGGAFTNPASTMKRFIRFGWNGTKWVEIARAANDY